MDRVISYGLTDDFIARAADYIETAYVDYGRDLSRIAVVFGGRRPALFLKRELSLRFKKSFFPPVFFSIDQLMERIVAKKGPFSLISDLDACFIIYEIAKKYSPEILQARKTFALFLPWAAEILRFIESLDLEDVPIHSLKDIQLHADIGYDVPPNVNLLLSKIIILAENYRKTLLQKKSYSRGMLYRLASTYVAQTSFHEFDHILFCNFFYLHKTEEQVIKSFYERQKGVLFFQGHADDWSVLGKVSKNLSVPIAPLDTCPAQYALNIFSGPDVHAQVCLVHDILKKIGSLEKTVIVLPEPEHVVALLSEISSSISDFNVSMGYPVKRSLLYSLFDFLFKAQETKKDGQYYVKDYVRLLSHPLIKNLSLFVSGSVTRVLVHRIEEYLTGVEKSPVSGSLFIRLADLEDLQDLYESAQETLKGMGVEGITCDGLKTSLRQLHQYLFYAFEDISNLYDFSCYCEKLLDVLVQKSMLASYLFNLKVADKIFNMFLELKNASFNREVFSLQDCFNIFKNKLEHEALAFNGSPLKGLQILGLFETRCLNFENVIVMDMNESVLPKLKIYEPLVPRDVMISLGLNRLEKEEEIQRYQFMRLISHAKNVFLVYQEDTEKEKSRFIEDLVWQKQKTCGCLDVVSVTRGVFQVKVAPHKMKVMKTPQQVIFLKSRRYSASSVDTYLYCPLRFYYRYVLGLTEKQEFVQGPEASDIGNFVHELLEEAFRGFVGRKPDINREFREYFNALFERIFEKKISAIMRSDAFLVKEVLQYRLGKFLDYEQSRDVKEILFLEKKFEEDLVLGENTVHFECRMDRVDRLFDESLLIIDYKTGSTDMKPAKNISFDVLSRDMIKERMKSFQLPLYVYFLKKQFPQTSVNAALYSLRESNDASCLKMFLDKAGWEQQDEIVDVFMRSLACVMDEIFDPRVAFEADEGAPHRCAHCPFFYLCR
ncbi:MAG: PD-(D/E)XK nuclease family protein [Candidatus Omnitrophota bacterium]